VLVEHARNVIGIDDATHAESRTDGTKVITPLSCSLDGRQIAVALTPGTMLASLHDQAATVTELTTCNYGLDTRRQDIASQGGMVASGIDATGEVRAVERLDHPFFVATLYQPQLRSTAQSPHPVWQGFLNASRTASRVG
jgi:CTP synthase (UTP-ammonia lyase)